MFCLLSLWFSKPIGFWAGRYLYAQTPEQIAYFNAAWHLPYLRFVSVVWGLALLGEVLTSAFLAYHLSIAQFQMLGPLVFTVTITALATWSMLYAGVSISKREKCTLSKTGGHADLLMCLPKRIEERS